MVLKDSQGAEYFKGLQDVFVKRCTKITSKSMGIRALRGQNRFRKAFRYQEIQVLVFFCLINSCPVLAIIQHLLLNEPADQKLLRIFFHQFYILVSSSIITALIMAKLFSITTDKYLFLFPQLLFPGCTSRLFE